MDNETATVLSITMREPGRMDIFYTDSQKEWRIFFNIFGKKINGMDHIHPVCKQFL